MAVPVLRPLLPHEAAHHEPRGATPRAVPRLRLSPVPRERAHLPGAAQAHLQAVLRIRIHMFLGLPDPDPHVFGPPGSGSTSQRYGSGSGSFYHHAKIVRKNLIEVDSYYFVTLFDFLSLKNDVNVPSKRNKQKKLC